MSEVSPPSAVDRPSGPTPVIADHELIRRIGSGAYGEVWLARNVTGMYRAVKVVWRASFEHERSYEREFSGLKRFEPISRLHPGLIDVLQVGREDSAGYYYYVIELADPAEGDGSVDPEHYVPLTLAEAVRRRGRLPVGECARIGAMVAEGVGFLHERGLVHRDVKPTNILFVGGMPKMADVGLVAGLGDARSFVGTEGYIPPEGPGSPPADLFSLGKVLYEMVTGRSRLDFPDLPRELLETEDAASFADLNEILLRACAGEVSQRYRTATELRSELLLIEAGRSVRRLRRNERLIRRWQRIGAVALLLGFFGVVAAVLERDRTQRANRRASSEAAQRRIVEEKERVGRQNLYAADVNLAQQAIDGGNFGRADELLAAYRPGPDEEDLRGFEWHHLWHRVRGDSIGILAGHDEVVSTMALSPDGERLYSGSFDSTVREWSIAGARELRRWTLPGCAIMAMAVDRTGASLAVEGGNRPQSGILDLTTGTWTTRILSASPSIAFAPGGDRLVRGARMLLFDPEGVVEIVDRKFEVVRVLERAGGRACFSPDGRMLATGSWHGVIKLWAWPSLESLGELPDAGMVIALGFSPDGSRLATGSRDGRLILWDPVRRRRLEEKMTHEGTILWSVAFSPDGRRLASVGNDQTVRVWDGASLTPQQVFRGHGSEVWAVLWTPDGQRLVSAGKDATIRIWDAAPARVTVDLDDVVQAPEFSPDERRIAVLQRGGIQVIDLSTGRGLRHFDAVALGGFSADGKSVSLLRDAGSFERRRVEDGALLEARSFLLMPGTPTRRRLSSDGRWLLTGWEGGEILVQDLGSNRGPRWFQGHRQRVVEFEVSPDGRQLVSGSMDRTARLWDLETGQELHRFEGHRMAVASAAFSPDGTQLVTGSWDDTVRLWDLGSRRLVARFGGHSSGVHDVAFAPDHRTLAVLSGVGVLKFWSLAAGREAGVVEHSRGTGLGSLGFSPGGNWLGVVGQSGKLTLMPAPREPAQVLR